MEWQNPTFVDLLDDSFFRELAETIDSCKPLHSGGCASFETASCAPPRAAGSPFVRPWFEGASSMPSGIAPPLLLGSGRSVPRERNDAPVPSFHSIDAAPSSFSQTATTAPQSHTPRDGSAFPNQNVRFDWPQPRTFAGAVEMSDSRDKTPSCTTPGMQGALLPPSFPFGLAEKILTARAGLSEQHAITSRLLASPKRNRAPPSITPGQGALLHHDEPPSALPVMPPLLHSAAHGGIAEPSSSLPRRYTPVSAVGASLARHSGPSARSLLAGSSAPGWHPQPTLGAALGSRRENLKPAPHLELADYARALTFAQTVVQSAPRPLPPLMVAWPRTACSSSCGGGASVAVSSNTDTHVSTGAPRMFSHTRRGIEGFWAMQAADIASDAAARSERVASTNIGKKKSRKRVCQACGRAKSTHSPFGKRTRCFELTCACGLLIKLHARSLPAGMHCTGECARVLNRLCAKQFGSANTPPQLFGCGL